MARRILALAVLFTPTLSSPAVLAAQQPIELDELVVTATRSPRAARAVASHVTVLDGRELEGEGVATVADALRTVPGVDVVRNGSSFGATTSVFLRGGESDHVQVLIDGIPANEAGGRFDFAHLMVEQIERIEVVRGPASSLYGSDAVTGVIQVFTRTGSGAPAARASVEGGTFGTWRGSAGLEGGSGPVSWGFGGSLYRTDGVLDLNNEYDNATARGRVELTPDSTTLLAVSAHYVDHAFHFPTDGTGAVVDENSFTFGDELTLGLDLRRRVKPAVELRARVGTRDRNGGLEDLADGPADTLGFFGFRSLDDARRTWGEAAAEVRTPGAGTFTLGLTAEEQTLRTFSESMSEFGASTGTGDHERGNRAAFGQWVVERGPVAGNVSLRVEDNEAFGTLATWSLGTAVWLAGTGTKLRGSVGRGIREPTLAENFASGFARGNPDLDPERSTSWELGVDQALLAGRLRIAATWFDQEFEDLIQFTAAPPSAGDPSFFNVGAATARGVELEASLAVGLLELGAGWTWLDTEVVDAGFDEGSDAEFVEGARLLRRPTHRFSVRAEASRGPARLGASLRWVGDREDRDFSTFPAARIELPAYAVLDLRGELRLWEPVAGRPGLALTARVDNLLDEGYAEIAGFPAPGRALRVGGRVTVGE